MKITDELVDAWKDIKKPNGFVADIEAKSEAEMEYGDIENYFSGLGWREVNPEADNIRYMCPLIWMNIDAAKYYSLSYLVYLASSHAIETQYDVPEMVLDYFADSEFSILSKLTKVQQTTANKAIEIYKRRVNT